jgi:hypothetical protein
LYNRDDRDDSGYLSLLQIITRAYNYGDQKVTISTETIGDSSDYIWFFIGILVTQSHGKTGHLIHQFATGSMET